MQKLLMILICMFIGSAHATEMCAKNDTVVIPLDATVSGSSSDGNSIEWIWWAEFPYGKIYGYATNLSLQEIQEIQNDPDLTTAPSVLDTDSDELIGRSGTDANGNTRNKFYYKLAHPMASNWVLYWEVRSLRDLIYAIIRNDSGPNVRSLMFNAIGASMAEKKPEAETE